MTNGVRTEEQDVQSLMRAHVSTWIGTNGEMQESRTFITVGGRGERCRGGAMKAVLFLLADSLLEKV